MDRDDLVERVAEGLRNNSLEEMGEAETAPFSAAPVDLREYWLKRARIALAIIEPAVREEVLRVGVWTEEERDGMAAAYKAASMKHGHYETLFAVGAWLLRRRAGAATSTPPSEAPSA